MGRERDGDKDVFYTFLYSLHMSISSGVIFCNKENSDGIKLNVCCKLSCAAFIGSMPDLWVCCLCISVD